MMDIYVPISQDLVDLSESNSVLGTDAVTYYEGGTDAHQFTSISRAEDGTYYFYEFSNTYSIWIPGSEYGSPTILHKYSFTEDAPDELKEETIEVGSDEYMEICQMHNSLSSEMKTENASIVPDGAQLGDYPHVYDAVKIGNYYYVASLHEAPSIQSDPANNALALSKMDENGNLIKQVSSIEDGFIKDRYAARVPIIRLQEGPNSKLALQLFHPGQSYDDSHLTNHASTLFYDLDLSLEGRLDNNSTGCGTWLDDGRYLAFTQRLVDTYSAETDDTIIRKPLISYDITDVIDPPVEIEYIPEDDGKTATWEDGSDEGLPFVIHRDPNDSAETCKEHFQGVKVDGDLLTEGTDYTVEFASVHIALLPDYLKALSPGQHTLTVLFDDANDVIIPFTIQQNSPAPNTGDTTNLTLWIVLMAVALVVIIGIVIVLVIRKKK